MKYDGRCQTPGFVVQSSEYKRCHEDKDKLGHRPPGEVHHGKHQGRPEYSPLPAESNYQVLLNQTPEKELLPQPHEAEHIDGITQKVFYFEGRKGGRRAQDKIFHCSQRDTQYNADDNIFEQLFFVKAENLSHIQAFLVDMPETQ